MRTNFIALLFALSLASCSGTPAGHDAPENHPVAMQTAEASFSPENKQSEAPALETASGEAQLVQEAPALKVAQKTEVAEHKTAVPGETATSAATEEPATTASSSPERKKAATTAKKTLALKKTVPPLAKQKTAPVSPPSHEAWDKLLRQYVSAAGKVNYAGLKKDAARLDAYLATLAAAPPQSSWSRSEKMAFWINAYNANTVKLIVDNYPLSSITKLQGGNPWKVEWVKIGSKTYSLDFIENGILRPQFKDARIHFAVNCAAKSCPPLLNRAWTAANLESDFEQRAKTFINNPAFNKIGANEVQVSKIFEWYAGDFGNLISFLNKYSSAKIKTTAKVKYLEYNWELNE
ncbi:MAG: DUF547 domain-containing protein [Saprospiraceae bacterium]